jgi:hypothetical protein
MCVRTVLCVRHLHMHASHLRHGLVLSRVSDDKLQYTAVQWVEPVSAVCNTEHFLHAVLRERVGSCPALVVSLVSDDSLCSTQQSVLDRDSYELHVINGALQWVEAALCACPAVRARVGCYCLLTLHARCCHYFYSSAVGGASQSGVQIRTHSACSIKREGWLVSTAYQGSVQSVKDCRTRILHGQCSKVSVQTCRRSWCSLPQCCCLVSSWCLYCKGCRSLRLVMLDIVGT